MENKKKDIFFSIFSETFVKNAIKYLRQYEFDGLDIDWVLIIYLKDISLIW